ncbi:MAG TPA: ACP S-malonyltransferase, partial [Pseudonocardiaceae bacterium]
ELGLDAANRNGAGQVVAAGRRPALTALCDAPPAGSRVVPLPVAGAFHTRFMTPARDTLAVHADTVKVDEPYRTLLSNADGRPVTDGTEVLRRLVSQVTSPVRWDACMATMRELGVTTTIEFPPAGTLSGLARRDLKGVTTVAVRTPADLDKAVAALAGAGAAA